MRIVGDDESFNHIRSQEDVEAYLKRAFVLLKDDDTWTINDKPRASGKVNRTLQYMTEKNVLCDDVQGVIQGLSVKNYSYTDIDRNCNFLDEEFWFFGITTTVVDQEEKLYIKLKIRIFDDGTEMLLVMSFHPEDPPDENAYLKFPYN